MRKPGTAPRQRARTHVPAAIARPVLQRAPFDVDPPRQDTSHWATSTGRWLPRADGEHEGGNARSRVAARSALDGAASETSESVPRYTMPSLASVAIRRSALGPVVQRAEGDTTYYYALGPTDLHSQTTDHGFQQIYEGKVKKGGARFLDQDGGYKPKEGKESEIAAGTKGTWYLHPDRPNVAMFQGSSQQGWVSAAALDGAVVRVPTHARVTLVTPYDTPVKGANGKVMLQLTWGTHTAWVVKSNIGSQVFNTKYATPLSATEKGNELEYNRGAHGGKEGEARRRKSRGIFEKGAPNAVIKVSDARQLNVLPRVNNAKASSRAWNEETQTFVADGGTLTQGSPVVIKEEKLVAERKGKNTVHVRYARVVTTDGTEVWTWAGNENRTATLRGNLTMVPFSAGELDPYTNATFRAALASAYSDSVKGHLAGKSDFSAAQKGLFEEARAFLTDGAAQAKVSSSLTVNAAHMSLEGKTLNADLIARVKLFHKFMVSKDLVTSASAASSDGVRSAAEAHKKSTSYYIRDGKIPYSKLNALNNGTDHDGNVWYVPKEDDVMKEVTLDAAELAAEQEKKKADPKYVPRTKKSVLDELATMEKCKSRAMKISNGNKAAEGYPAGSEERKPNLDTLGVSNHMTGNAIDITIPFKLNYFDPVIDGLAAIFGLFRAVKDDGAAEHWHYERVGALPAAQGTADADHPGTK